MKLHFLGTTGYHPNDHRHTACLMLPEKGVIFDAGTGMFRVRNLIQTETLDIFLSHVHLDHVIGLTYLYDVLFEKKLKRVTVHVAEDKIAAIEQHLYHEKLFPVKPNFEFSPIGEQTIRVDDEFEVMAIPLEHPGGCHGFRVVKGAGMAYITDTSACPSADYVSHINGVKTLVHECYFPDGWEDRAELTGHSCLTPVAQVARAANVGRVFLVHVNPLDPLGTSLNLESVRPIFENIEVATDQLIIEV